jgi:mRNA interferase RelE/StbE
MFKVLFFKQAAKYYAKLDVNTQSRIHEAIDEIIKNPFEGFHIKKLKGELEGNYRYGLGDFRIIYSVDARKKIIYINAIGPRGDIYK